MPPKIRDRLAIGIRDRVKDDRPRIWCNHCDRQNNQTCDTASHYKNNHAQFLPAEQRFWVFETYANSRHGTGPDADLARLRTQQVLSFLNGGPPVSAAPFGPAGPGVIIRAAIASTLPSRNRQVQTALEGTPIAQAAPVQATPALTGRLATVHTTAPPPIAAPTHCVHIAASAALATNVPSVRQTLLPPLAVSTHGSYNVLPAPRDTSRAPPFRAIPGYLDLPAPALAEDGTSSNNSNTSEDSSRMDVAQGILSLQRDPRINQAQGPPTSLNHSQISNELFGSGSASSQSSSTPMPKRKRVQKAMRPKWPAENTARQNPVTNRAAAADSCVRKAKNKLEKANKWIERAKKSDPRDGWNQLFGMAQLKVEESGWWMKRAATFAARAAADEDAMDES